MLCLNLSFKAAPSSIFTCNTLDAMQCTLLKAPTVMMMRGLLLDQLFQVYVWPYCLRATEVPAEDVNT